MAFDVCDDIRTLLTGIVSDVYLHDLVEEPDNFIGVSFIDGGSSQHTLSSGSPAFERPSIEVFVRHTSTATALDWLEDIKDALDGQTKLTINGHYYISIMQDGDVEEIGKDSKHRTGFKVDFNVLVVR